MLVVRRLISCPWQIDVIFSPFNPNHSRDCLPPPLSLLYIALDKRNFQVNVMLRVFTLGVLISPCRFCESHGYSLLSVISGQAICRARGRAVRSAFPGLTCWPSCEAASSRMKANPSPSAAGWSRSQQHLHSGDGQIYSRTSELLTTNDTMAAVFTTGVSRRVSCMVMGMTGGELE